MISSIKTDVDLKENSFLNKAQYQDLYIKVKDAFDMDYYMSILVKNQNHYKNVLEMARDPTNLNSEKLTILFFCTHVEPFSKITHIL